MGVARFAAGSRNWFAPWQQVGAGTQSTGTQAGTHGNYAPSRALFTHERPFRGNTPYRPVKWPVRARGRRV